MKLKTLTKWVLFLIAAIAGVMSIALEASNGQGVKRDGDVLNALFFFDDWMLRTRDGLDRKQGKPVLVKEIKLGTHPELSIIRGGKFSYDECLGRYVMYVDCHHKDDRSRFTFRLETDDPYNWPMPQWASGSGPLWTRTENPVLDQKGNPLCCYNVLCLEGTPLEEKGYFMNFYNYKIDDQSLGPVIAYSRDGFHWEVDTTTHWIPHLSDTGNPPIYNPRTGQFMIFCRPEFIDRRVAQVTTTDLKKFSPVTIVLQPDAQDPVRREFYGLDPILYEDVFVSILGVYDTEQTENKRIRHQGTNETHLAYSYNGKNWYRAFREPFFPRTEPGTPFGGSVYMGAPIRTPENRLLFCVMGSWVEHGAGGELPEGYNPFLTYLYDMRLDGFSYLKTRARHGMIQTKTVISHGGDLSVNTRTTPTGYVKVVVLDGTLNADTFGEPLPNYTLEDAIPITGDELFGKVRWNNRDNLDELKGKAIILQVHVRDGELYALRFQYQVGLGKRPGEEGYHHY